MKSQKHPNVFTSLLILTLIFVYSFFGIIFVAMVSLLLAIALTIAIFVTAVYFFKDKNYLILLLFLALISLASLKMAIRDTVRDNNCFETNVSYPGTEKYQNCIDSLKVSDYLLQIFSF